MKWGLIKSIHKCIEYFSKGNLSQILLRLVYFVFIFMEMTSICFCIEIVVKVFAPGLPAQKSVSNRLNTYI